MRLKEESLTDFDQLLRERIPLIRAERKPCESRTNFFEGGVNWPDLGFQEQVEWERIRLRRKSGHVQEEVEAGADRESASED